MNKKHLYSWYQAKPNDVLMKTKAIHYRLTSTTKKDPLIRATGLHKQKNLNILDCTGGLGHDTLVMAYFSANVTVLEQSLATYLELQETVEQTIDVLDSTPLQITCIHDEAMRWINKHTLERFDVVYCDPMFPKKKKSAKSKQIMQKLALAAKNNEEDNQQLIKSLIQLKPTRLVLKRPLRAPCDYKPHHVIQGKSHRFDIFINKPTITSS